MKDEFTILYVDDEAANLNLFYNSFKKQYRIIRTREPLEALKICGSEPVDLILSDQRMPGMKGTELLSKLAREYPKMVRILMTGYADVNAAIDAINRGKVHRYVSKPWEKEELAEVLKQELQLYRLHVENERLLIEVEENARVLAEKNHLMEIANRQLKKVNRDLEKKNREYKKLYRDLQQQLEENKNLREAVEDQYSLQGIIGKSPQMQHVFQMIRDVSASDATVLILGESGTGKELVASAIHKNSSRNENPFIAINCAALPESLLESELFGHEKGAFTGAHQLKRGKFEQAQKGTIFLDEIGDISPAAQVRLLRILQEKNFQRVGGEKIIQADVRIISATNRDLQALVTEGKFREDLFYRLNVISIEIPPLHERVEDIPLLIYSFLNRYAAVAGKKIQGFTPEAMQILLDYHWPGNVRELQNVVERAVVLCKAKVITSELFPLELQQLRDSSNAPHKTLYEAEKELILKTLEVTHWNKHKAAEMLDITRSSLYSKIQKYDLKQPED